MERIGLEKTKNSSNEAGDVGVLASSETAHWTPLVTRSLRYHAIENEDGLSCQSSESTDIELESTIYEAAAITIINSIINAYGNSLNHLQLPKKWHSVSISTFYKSFIL